MSAPAKIWVRTFKTGYKQATLSQQPFDPAPCGYDDAEYRRTDLTPPAADYVAGLEAALRMAAYNLELSALTANPAKRAIVRGFAVDARAALATTDKEPT